MSSDHRIEAKKLLLNYFKAVAEKAGMKWDPDYTAEVEDIVDHIVDAAVEEACEYVNNNVKTEAMR